MVSQLFIMKDRLKLSSTHNYVVVRNCIFLMDTLTNKTNKQIEHLK